MLGVFTVLVLRWEKRVFVSFFVRIVLVLFFYLIQHGIKVETFCNGIIGSLDAASVEMRRRRNRC